MPGQIEATLILGDGIGPEIAGSLVRVFETLDSPFAWDIRQGGMAGLRPAAIRCRKTRWTASAARG